MTSAGAGGADAALASPAQLGDESTVPSEVLSSLLIDHRECRIIVGPIALTAQLVLFVIVVLAMVVKR